MKQTILLMTGLLFTVAISAQPTDYRSKAKALVAQLTLEEKASLCSGQTEWKTKSVERLSIPSIFMTDGPHGLRKAEGFDFANSVPATCFPTASALASSWNTTLVNQVGIALGQECQANDVQILLGPGVNMKRSPLGGRNFEYFSEDPLLSGKMAVALINGVQSQGIGSSLKHFAANNQELERFTNNSIVDERTLHEIYLPAFETAVKEAQPWTVMCSYNRINGVQASQNPLVLHDILKTQWGFKGFVVSDWGAVVDRAEGIKAGLHLEMPASNGVNDKKIVAAVNKGELTMARLDEVVTDLLTVILQAKDAHKPGSVYDKQQHNELARKVSAECAVLLKNDNILPLNFGVSKRIAVIGAFAKTPRYQGAGSSQVIPTQVSNAYDELKKLAGNTDLKYSAGYTMEATTTDAMIAKAVQAAKQSQVAIVFAGLPSEYESEGYDRTNINMPESHNKLIAAVAKANPNTVVVLMNGSAVSMPWVANVKGIIEAWLGGQAGSGALADVLTGKVNPSGKLSETFPVRVEDNPTFLNFPGTDNESVYGEGLFIGYRYYDKKKVAPMFPFGYGLSYTSFAYSGITASTSSIKDTDSLTISFKVKNTGKVAGKEVVQLYVHDQNKTIVRPEKELKHFTKIALLPGEEQTVSFRLGFRDFAYYDVSVHDWVVNTGVFDILVGGSSVSLPLKQNVQVTATKVLAPVLNRFSMMKLWAVHPKGKAIYQRIMGGMSAPAPANETAAQKTEREKSAATMAMFMQDMPIYKMVTMSRGNFTDEMLDEMLKMVNQ